MNKPKLREIKEVYGASGAFALLIDALLEDDAPVTPTPVKTPKFFVPVIGERYWFITQFNGVASTLNLNKESDIYTISLGVFRTEAEAEQAFEKQKALVRLWQAADEKFYFRPDWKDFKEEKFDIFFGNEKDVFLINKCFSSNMNFSLPYFATKADAEKFIEENAKDLEIYRVN